MKKLIVLFVVLSFLSSCVHDTYSMSHWSGDNNCFQKFKATKPDKRKVWIP